MGRTSLFFRSFTDAFGITNEKKTKHLEWKEDMKDIGIDFDAHSKPISAKQQAKEQVKYERTIEKERAKYAQKAANKAKVGAFIKSGFATSNAQEQATLTNAKLTITAISFDQAATDKIYEGITVLVNETKNALLPKGVADRQAMFLKGERLSVYEMANDKLELGLFKIQKLIENGESDSTILTMAKKKQAELEAIKETIAKHRKRLLIIGVTIIAVWTISTVVMMTTI